MKRVILLMLLSLLMGACQEKKECTTKSTNNTNDLSIDTCAIPIDINGLYIDSLYSREEIIKAMGEPTSSEYSDEVGLWSTRYKSGLHNSGFTYFEKKGITDFGFYDNRFKIYNGLITVGEPISKFKMLGCGELVEYPKNDYTFFTSKNPKKNVFFIKTDGNGIIISIVFYREDDYGFEGDENTEL